VRVDTADPIRLPVRVLIVELTTNWSFGMPVSERCGTQALESTWRAFASCRPDCSARPKAMERWFAIPGSLPAPSPLQSSHSSFLSSVFGKEGAVGTKGSGRRGWIFRSTGPAGGVAWCSTTTSPENSNGDSTASEEEAAKDFFSGRGGRSSIAFTFQFTFTPYVLCTQPEGAASRALF
jgi:hypothetical protein